MTASTRPRLPAKSASESPGRKRADKPSPEVETDPAVCRDTSDTLRKFLHVPLGLERRNYVFRVVRRQGDEVVYKLGYSDNIRKRILTIKKNCEFAEITEIQDGIIQSWSKAAYMAEQLIHAELRRFKSEEACVCKTRHKEYFKVSKEVALLDAHRRWVSFCNKEPWGEGDQLLPFWLDRLNSMPELDNNNCNYGDIAARWDDFTNATDYDYWLWEAQVLLNEARGMGISLVAALEAVVIFGGWPSAVTFALVAVLIFFCGKEARKSKVGLAAERLSVRRARTRKTIGDGPKAVSGKQPARGPALEAADEPAEEGAEEDPGEVPSKQDTVQADIDQAEDFDVAMEDNFGGSTETSESEAGDDGNESIETLVGELDDVDVVKMDQGMDADTSSLSLENSFSAMDLDGTGEVGGDGYPRARAR